MPPTPPQGGYGPANYAGGRQSSPYDSANNTINYNEMAQYEAISQYRQMPATSYMSEYPLRQQQKLAFNPIYQYGVGPGQDDRLYNRQAAMNRMSYSASMASAAAYTGIAEGVSVGMGLWKVGATARVAGAAAGIGMGGMAVSMLAPILPMYFVDRGIQNSLERQQYMHQIATDVETYRGRLGFNNLSYGAASSLGAQMSSDMFKPDQFFNREQQMRIHKIGLSNDMLTARGAGAGLTGGTIEQYRRNFNELRDTTQEVVKLLKTTIEGGMSVMKELQGAGFNSMKQIRQQVLQAKAFGDYTGIGSQNMMQIGVAGAQSVQGTPWQAAVGASMYQTGAMQATAMARTGAMGSYAVERVGGVAAAGGILARAQMNVAMSGYGTRMAAFAMNPDGTMNNSRMSQLMYGQASAYGVVTGANATGYAMGESGRALFPIYKEQFYNNLNDQGRTMVMMNAFNLWGQNRRGTTEAKAYKFAGQFTNDPREQFLLMQNILSPKGFATQAATRSAERMLAADTITVSPIKKMFRDAYTSDWSIPFALEKAGSNLMLGTNRMFQQTGYDWGEFQRNLSTSTSNMVGRAFGFEGGAWNTSRKMNSQELLRRSYGLEDMGGGVAGASYLQSMSLAQKNAMREKPLQSIGGIALTQDRINGIFARASAKDAMYLASTLQAASFADDPTATLTDIFSKNARIKGLVGENLANAALGNVTGTAYTLLAGVRNQYASVATMQERAMPGFIKYQKDMNSSQLYESNMRVAIMVGQLDRANERTGGLLEKNYNTKEFNSLAQVSSTMFKDSAGPLREKAVADWMQKKVGLATVQGNEYGTAMVTTRAAAAMNVESALGINTRAENKRVPLNMGALAGSVLTGNVFGAMGLVGGAIGISSIQDLIYRRTPQGKTTGLIKDKYGYGGLTQGAREESLINAYVGINQNLLDAAGGDENAKKNIIQFQKATGIDLYNDKDERTIKWRAAYDSVMKSKGAQAQASKAAGSSAWASYAMATGVDKDTAEAFRGMMNGSVLDPKVYKGKEGILGATFGYTASMFTAAMNDPDKFKKMIDDKRAVYDPAGAGSAKLAEEIKGLASSIVKLSVRQDTPYNREAHQAELNAKTAELNAKKTLLEQSINETKGGPGSPGTSIAVTPKVLNYWSNQWVL